MICVIIITIIKKTDNCLLAGYVGNVSKKKLFKEYANLILPNNINIFSTLVD